MICPTNKSTHANQKVISVLCSKVYYHMGICLSSLYKRRFVVKEEIEGQGSSALEVFTSLGLTSNDIDLLFTAFWDIDADGSGLIRPSELFSYFEVEGTKFEKGVFSLFDEDHSGMINFMEFVCTLWNLLTLPESDYGALAFLIKDPTAVGTINFTDVRQLMEMMHSKKIDKDPALNGVFTKMRKELGNAFTIHEFNKWTAANPHVVSPIMMLQLHIRLQIIGESFWAKLAIQRKEHPEQGQLDYVKKLQQAIISKKEAYKERLALEEAEKRRLSRLGRGKLGDCRDNVTRKQSVLLGFFNMKRSMHEHNQNRQGKSLSRIFVLADDNDEEDVVIAGGQSASGKRRNPNPSEKKTCFSPTTDPFLDSNIRTKPMISNSTSSPSAVTSNNTSLSGESPTTTGKSLNAIANSNKEKLPKKRVSAITAIQGDNRRRRSSLTLQKPNLLRELVDKRKKKEDKYKLEHPKNRNKNRKSTVESKDRNKRDNQQQVKPIENNDNSSDSEEEF